MLPETWPEPGAHANMFTVVGRQSGSVSLSVPDAATISSVVLYRLGHMSLKLFFHPPTNMAFFANNCVFTRSHDKKDVKHTQFFLHFILTLDELIAHQ